MEWLSGNIETPKYIFQVCNIKTRNVKWLSVTKFHSTIKMAWDQI